MKSPDVELNVFETILARRSVRSFLADEIDRETIRSLLEAAVRAPSAIHEEPWAFVIVQNRQLLQRLSDSAKPLFAAQLRRSGGERSDQVLASLAKPDFNLLHDAGTLIIICARQSGPFVAADCWLAAENLMLAACAMGLGTCVIGSALGALDTQELKTQLGIPADYAAIAPIVVGRPRGPTPATSRREPLILSWL